MLEIKNLHKRFKNNIVLDGIDLTINKGDIIGIVGPSGTGKSTLLRSINLLEKPEEGTILIDDIELNLPLRRADKKKVLEIRRKTGMVFQRFNLFEHKTALENVMEGLIVIKRIDKEEARKIALEELEKVGLKDKQNHYPKI